MSQRLVRVNELLKREISEILRHDFQAESVYITITKVDVTPNLRSAKVYYSVLGDSRNEREASKLLTRIAGTLRHQLNQRVTLKYSPALQFFLDPSLREGIALVDRMEEIENNESRHKLNG